MYSASQRGTALVKVEVGGIGEISDPPLVPTDYPHYYLRLSSAFKFIKTEPPARARVGTRGKSLITLISP
jgi:hypothetical protein